MDRHNQDYQNNNSESFSQEVEEAEEPIKKKSLSAIVIIEIILFVIVLVLAFTFFSSRSDSSFFSFFSKEKTGVIDKVQVDKPRVNDIDDLTYDNLEPAPGDNEVYVPISGQTTVVESLRLSLEVPDQSAVSSEADIPEGAIRIEGLESGFSPSEFKVKKGEMITLALTSRVGYPYILTFYEDSMPAISIGLGPQETRWISFKTPEVAGEYQFRNDSFGKNDQSGKMIVE